ncbi:MAG TPA: MotA/TolQ/ExbB proton channel family protein [Cytophagales bacterium]|nr:MotA/TolQ/ExbB proton channel family protein [Cytophagales bacterium]
MKNSNSKPSKPEVKGRQSMFAIIVIPIIFIVSILFYIYYLGNPSNFAGGDVEKGTPLNYFGTVYHGGFIVPILISCLVMAIVFSIERAITLSKARGKGSVLNFVKKIRSLMASGQIDQAIVECDKQKGSVANVVRAGLLKYKDMEGAQYLDQEKKILAIQKDIEETTQLEMPMLEKNLTIIATLASVATLIGLLGTVIGMIKAFAAMTGSGGAPDSAQLALGISEALINTALGIGGSAVAIISYNFFTSKIDELTYSIDEIGFSLVQNFAAKNVDKVVI